MIHERCLQINPNDREVWGWRALVKGLHIKPYQRRKKVNIDKFGLGGAGALTDLFNEFPNFRADFDERILKPVKAKELGDAKKTAKDHWAWFLNTLREIFKKNRISAETRWPFNTDNQGYVTVCRYIKRIYNENPNRAALLVGGPDNQKKWRLVMGQPVRSRDFSNGWKWMHIKWMAAFVCSFLNKMAVMLRRSYIDCG